MSAPFSLRHPRRLSRRAGIAALAAAIAAGCGIDPAHLVGTSADSKAGLDSHVRYDGGDLTKIVVLDWTGGYSEIVSEKLAPTNFSWMHLTTGQSLEDHAASFQESVRLRVEEILSAIEPAMFVVVTGEAEDYPDDTIVYLTSDAIRGGGYQVGQTKLDRCDLNPRGSVIVWGGTLLMLGDNYGYDQWVNAFANTAAHEVGHTVGFFHPDAVLTDLTDYEKDTELMLGVHTLSALLGRQEFIIPQETCPESIESEFGGVAYELAAASTVKRTAVTYKTTPHPDLISCDLPPD